MAHCAFRRPDRDLPGTMARLALRLLAIACLVAAVTPSPKTEGGSSTRTEGGPKKKSTTSAQRRAAAEHPHPTVPRSRLHNTATPAPPPLERGERTALAAKESRAAGSAGSKGGSSAAPQKPGKDVAQTGAAGAPVGEEGDLSTSERAALLGGLLLAPAGIGGFLLGCSIGGGSVLLYDKMAKGVQKALSDYKSKHHLNVEGGFRSFESLTQLNEITVKAATEEEAEAFKERLTALLAAKHNRKCFDCTHVEEDAAVWASINLGVFVCERCAGMHRALGTHKSRIKSAYADVWTPEMIEVRASACRVRRAAAPPGSSLAPTRRSPRRARPRSAWSLSATQRRRSCTERSGGRAWRRRRARTWWRRTSATSTPRSSRPRGPCQARRASCTAAPTGAQGRQMPPRRHQRASPSRVRAQRRPAQRARMPPA